MKKNMFSDRWFEDRNIEKQYKKLISFFSKGGVLNINKTPFYVTDAGYSDFRGIELTSKKVYKTKIEKIDFSYSSFQNACLEDSLFSDVVFYNTNFANLTEKKNTFYNTKFEKCNFLDAGIGYEGTVFNNCIFRNSDFKKAVFIRGEFNNTKFIDCDFRGIDFCASSFENCSFGGKLINVWFRGSYELESDVKNFGEARKNTMKNVSFENAVLEGVEFTNNCDLSTIIMPKNGNYKLYKNWKNRLQMLKNQIYNWPSERKSEAEIFVNSFLLHAENQDWVLLNLDELDIEFGFKLTRDIISVLEN